MTDFVEDIVKRFAPDATEQQITAAASRARDKCMANGGGLAQLFTDSKSAAEFVIREAIQETIVKAKLKGETDLAGPELIKLEGERLCFGKAGADAPLKHRGDYIKKYGQAAYDAALKTWGASATDLSPKKNPYTKAVKKQMRQARNGTLENTEFNQVFNADQIKKPKIEKVKLTREQKSTNPFFAENWNVTKQAQLYKLDPNLAASMAQRAGVRIGATKPVM